MAKNQSPYTVYVETEDDGTVAVAPGDDVPTGAKVDNPYVSGRKKADELPDELPPLPEAGDGVPVDDEEDSKKAAPRKATPKSADKADSDA